MRKPATQSNNTRNAVSSPFMHHRTAVSERGSVMLMVLITFTVISMIVGTVIYRTMSNYHTVVQTASWQEALLAAESGSDAAMAALRKTLLDPANAWNGWQTTDAQGNPLPNGGKIYTPAKLTHDGEGNTELAMNVTVDAPTQLVDANGRQWFRIRSTGTAFLPGNSRLNGGDKRDHALRKLSLVWDRKAGGAVSRPQVSRMIEAIARPVAVEGALIADGLIELNNYYIRIDSYDSRDPNKSTNSSYDSTKFQQHADIATNGKVIEAGNATVYGDASTNAGTILNAARITGEQRTDFYKELIPVKKPTWTVINPNPAQISNTMTIQGGPKNSPQRYKVSSIKEAGTSVLSLAPHQAGQESYVEIWVTGDISVSGGGLIDLQPGVHATIYVEGNMDINGSGIVNKSPPPYLQILGVNPTDGTPRSFELTGNGSFNGALYAPGADLVLSNWGSTGTYCGGFVAKTITMNNHTDLHYDEALSEAPIVTDYKIASWFEDSK